MSKRTKEQDLILSDKAKDIDVDNDIYNKTDNDIDDEDDIYNEIDNDEDEYLLDEDDSKDDDIKIVTDLKLIKKTTEKVRTKKPKVVGKHTLAFDSIHNSKREINEQLEEEYIIHDLNPNFNVNYDIDTTSNYNSDEYYQSNKLKNEVLNLLTLHTDIDFSPEVKRRIPSVADINAYFSMLLAELEGLSYSHLEIFVVLSEFFSDNTYNVYKKLSPKYKSIIYNDLGEKHKIADIEKMNFL